MGGHEIILKQRHLRFSLIALVLGGCGSGEYVDLNANKNGMADASDATMLPVSNSFGRKDLAPGDAAGDTATIVADVGADVSTDEGSPDAGAMTDVSLDAAAEAGSVDASSDGDACSGDVCGFDAGKQVCPVIDGYLINPINVFVGETVHLSVTASDANGDTIYYNWSAPQGTFDDPHAAKTSYRCSMAGTARLTLSVTDGICTDPIDFFMQLIDCHN
jgi:hypothetical protein